MKNSLLIDILKTFSKDEIKDFDKFISSPYIRCRKFILNLFRIIRKHHPEFKEQDIEKKKIFSEMYPDKKYNDGLFRRAVSEIVKLCEYYLMIKRFNKFDVFRNHCLLLELRERKLDKNFETRSGKIMKKLGNNFVHDIYSLLDKYLTEVQIYNYIGYKKPDYKSEKFESVETNIIFFLNSIGSNLAETAESEKFTKLTSDFIDCFDYDKFISLAEKINNKSLNMIKAYYYAGRITKDNFDEESFRKLKDLIQNEPGSFSNHQRMLICTDLFNYYSRFYNSTKETKYFTEQLDLYNSVLEEKLFLEYSPYINLSFLRNYFQVSKRAGKLNFITKFIKDYSAYFDPVYKENFLNYCTAELMFSKNNFDKVLEFTSKINFDKAIFIKDIKLLKIKSFYELNYLESVYYEIDSLKHFLNNTGLLKKNIILTGKNFCNKLNKLLKIREEINPDKLLILKKELEKEKFISEKNWLLEKVNGLL